MEQLEDRLAPASLTELTKLLPTVDVGDTRSDNDEMGFAVAIDGDTAIVGVRQDDSAATAGGSAYVFLLSGGIWVLQQKLTAFDAASSDTFGSAVSISGNSIVIGAPNDDTAAGSDAGSAYVYARTGGAWTQQQKLTASDAASGDIFGSAVSINGDSIVVGAPNDDTAAGSDAGSAYVYARTGGAWTQQQKLTASDAASGDIFGSAVSISGDSIVVGAYLDDTAAGSDAGSAYVYARTGGAWTQQQKLTASDASYWDYFGFSVSISGDSIVIGAHEKDTAAGGNAGSAYVYARTGVTWSQQQKLTASDAAFSDEFGISVSISGNSIVVGARYDDATSGSDSGSAYVYVRTGETWAQQQKLTAADAAAADHFGFSVSISGDNIIAGARYDDTAAGSDTGSAYVYKRTLSVWGGEQKLLSGGNARFDSFGSAVAIDGDTAIVGAPSDDKSGIDAGSAYIYIKSGTSWVLQQKLTASDAGAGDQFGHSVSISGDSVVVGALYDDTAAGSDFGSTYVFTRTGGTWTQQQKLSAFDAAAGDVYGFSVSINGDSVVVGSRLDDTAAGTDSGSAYVYTRTGGTWTQQQKLTAADAAAGDEFGFSVSINSDSVVVGALYDDIAAGSNAGSAYVYARTGGTWTQQQKLTASDAAASDQFGHSVSISGDSVVVGAYVDDTAAGADSGSAYVYARTGGTWTQQQKLVATDAGTSDVFGFSVAISGDIVIVGTRLDDTPMGSDAGSAYVFARTGGTWTQQHKLTASDAAAADQLGFSVSVSGDNVVVGARLEDTQDTDQGAVYVFTIVNENPVITSNGGGASVSIDFAENGTGNVADVNATDPDFDTTLTYSIAGGADASKFAINAATGVLTFVSPPNYESPTDAGANNVYDVVVQVSDGGLTDTQVIAVTVTPVNDNNPVISSIGALGGALDLRFDTDGKVTTAFSTGLDEIRAMAIDSDGKIVVVGQAFNPSNGTQDFLVARYTSIGALDNTFGINGKALLPIGSGEDVATAVAIDLSGRIVVAGSTFQSTQSYNMAVARFSTTGVLDGSFGSSFGTIQLGTTSAADYATSVAIDGAGKILVGGYSTINGNADFMLFRLTSTGGFDNTFDFDSFVLTPISLGDDAIHSIAIDGNGKIVVAGYATVGTTKDLAVARYLSTGALDTTFEGGTVTTEIGSSDDFGTSLAIDSGGKIVVAGYSLVGTSNDYALVRYNSNGTLDTTFDADGKVIAAIGAGEDVAKSIRIDSGGRIVVAGTSQVGASSDFSLARFTTNGSLDSSFDGDGKLLTSLTTGNDTAHAIAFDSSGRIVAAGSSSAGPSSTMDSVLARYSSFGGISQAENISAVATITATDADLPVQAFSYSIVGGADSSRFTINSTTGALALLSAPDFETPTDANLDNVYEVHVRVSDGSFSDTVAFSMMVTNLATVSTVYIDDSWAGLSSGATIPDADPGTAGNQIGTIGVNAFSNLLGVEALASGGTLVLLSGTYTNSVSLPSAFTLQVPTGMATMSGVLSGATALTKTGNGTLSLTNSNTFTGGVTVNAGKLEISSNAGLGNTANSVTVNPFGEVVFAGSTSSSRTFTLNSGSLTVNSGTTLTLNGASIGGGFLKGSGGSGVITTTLGASTSFVGNEAAASILIDSLGSDSFTNFTNKGRLTFVTGQSSTLWNFENAASGRLITNVVVSVSDFLSYGQTTLMNGGSLVNANATPLTFGGGSVTTINTGGSIEIGNVDAMVSGGLVRNSGSFGGAVRSVVVDYGGKVIGTGTFNSVVTQNGGVYSPGASPGAASHAVFDVNGAGIFEFEIANATGTAGALDGWDMATVAPNVYSPSAAELILSATEENPYTIVLTTRVNTGDRNAAGAAANFNPAQHYAWKFLDGSHLETDVTGTFAAAAFNVVTSGFQNAATGTFAVELRDSGKNLYIVYTPVAAPTVTSIAPVIGPTTGGTLVTILGANFAGTTSVTFDGFNAATFTVISGTQINAITAAHVGVGAVEVVVTNSFGAGSLAGTNDFTFAPSVSSVVVNGGPGVVFGASTFSLTGQHSVVKQILVTFREAVTVASDAFTVTRRTQNVTVNGGATPSTVAVVANSVTMLTTSEYLVTFNGTGTHGGGVIDSGVYDLTTLASKVTVGSQTMAANQTTTFFAMFGNIEANNRYQGAPITQPTPQAGYSSGNGLTKAFVDPGSLFRFSDTFGSNVTNPVGPPAYDIVFDYNLDGAIDPGDLFAFSDSFGIDWVF